MAMPTGYKPSPLGYGSPRNSPFRRPESPNSPSPLANRQATPTSSPSKLGSLCTPSRLANLSPTTTPTQESESRTPRVFTPSQNVPSSPPLASSPHMSSTVQATSLHQSVGHINALSQLQPAQVRGLRDGFQLMDRDSDGVVNREDVVDMLSQLGLSAKPSDVAKFFPPGGPQTMSLATFLNSIATPLAALSPAAELLSAFSAFDDDDSGQVDVGELRDALLRTPAEPGEHVLTAAEVDKIIAGFSGRRAFSKSSMTSGGGLAGPRRGEVFRYQEFVNSIMGVGGASEPNSNENPEG
ncbi:EF-hand [Xylaria sp. CBS 124048]|nr:EF-hand [Xylaria sp. CBS 124048]